MGFLYPLSSYEHDSKFTRENITITLLFQER